MWNKTYEYAKPDDTQPTKECLGDELLSFYKDIADLDKVTIEEVKSTPGSPPAPPPPSVVAGAAASETRVDIKHVDATAKGSKKKSKVKISSSMGMKHKTVSSMVAKWQQVADEITSD
ncbi:hypothetical protein EVAR_42556_1 [Eumeta japonica]|uniref:Uncharacterized protein n=1 Tax=Eumeta variegata TaxID=151549 RepID=A0A4C1WQR7_EUMVA|nr:hypothetical protein EVAR_42556_1 [Eumeta japonica]